VVAVMFAAVYIATCVAAGALLERVADIVLPGNPTRLDYQSLDPHRHLLFIAHLGDSNVIVVDTQKRRIVSTVPDVNAVHGVLAVPQLNTVYASATGTNEVVAIDEVSFKIRARTAAGVYPDGIAFDPRTGRLFVSDEHGGTDTVIDTSTNRRIGTIPLGGQVGNTQYDPVSGHIFANVQTLGQLLEIDPANVRIVRRIRLSGCAGNHGLLIDAPARRAFIACEDNAMFLWLDMRTMRVRDSWRVGADPDVLALDPGTHRLYVASESGVVSVFDVNRSVQRRWQGFLAPAAHTVAVDSEMHAVYFPLQNISGRPTLRVMAETERP
jgi:DNA-binding beta-propeller fold protein YncE